MKTKIAFAAVALLSTLNSQISTARAQGALTPPGAPAPTMKTLAQIEPRMPISAIPYTIASSGSYYLTTNLTGTSGQYGITIASGNVTLDLEGFALQGVTSSLSGIYVSGTYTNITIRNGSVSGWGTAGVDAYDGGILRSVVVERLTVSANSGYGILTQDGSVVRDCVSQGNGKSGIYSTGGVISGCGVRDNLSDGIRANNNCVVRDCHVQSNGGYGIYAIFSIVSGCFVQSSSNVGIYAASSTVSGCLVQGSVYSGIFVNEPGCQIIGNNCNGNNTSGSASDAGIYINASNNRVEDNHVTASGHTGIEIYPNYINNVIIKNTVSGNTNVLANNYIIPGINANGLVNATVAGPLISNYGTITNSNPWANFSY